MEISPGLGVAIMMNNYFHDVATALLLASSFCIYALVKTNDQMDNQVATLFYLKAYRQMGRIFRFALYWIVIGGIPRTIFYTRFEWANAAGKGQIPALIVKHVLITVCVVYGIYAWRKLKARAVRLESILSPEFARKL
jgi:hypothetical protein